MINDTKFNCVGVDLSTLVNRCNCLEEKVDTEIGKFKNGDYVGLALLTPVTSSGERCQDLHCMFLAWGGSSKYSSLTSVIKFVQQNFPLAAFQVEICDTKH